MASLSQKMLFFMLGLKLCMCGALPSREQLLQVIPCQVVKNADDTYHADCSGKLLEIVPDTIKGDPSEISSLDLSLNIIKSLGPFAFNHYPEITSLNLSTSAIEKVHKDSFQDLSALRVLDLTNNPFLAQVDRSSLDLNIPNLIRLFVSGEYVSTNLFTRLTNLQEITLTPDEKNMPYNLIKLSNLRVINFAFGNISHLTKELLGPFSSGRIEELTFHMCGIQHIEDGSFDGFSSLRLLNLACNLELTLNNVFNVISLGSDFAIESLILDLVGTAHGSMPVMLGKKNVSDCGKMWETLRHLSLRGTMIAGFWSMDCYENITSVALGFNVIFAWPHYDFWQALLKTNHLRYIDASYVMLHDEALLKGFLGCQERSSWIAPNHSYLPGWSDDQNEDNFTSNAKTISNSLSTTPAQSVKTYVSDIHKFLDGDTEGCIPVILPPHLTYVKLDNFQYVGDHLPQGCIKFSQNEVRMLNISYRHHYDDQGFDLDHLVVHGVETLEVLDMTSTGLSELQVDHLNMPNLRELYLALNDFGSGQKVPSFSHLPLLEVLDLSSNSLTWLSPIAFKGLTHLKVLNLRNNHLKDLNWLSIDLISLENLNVAHNPLQNFSFHKVQGLFDRLSKPSTFRMNTDSIFVCMCANTELIEFIQETKINILDKDKLLCDKGGVSTFIKDIDLPEMRSDCANTEHKALLSGLVLGTVLFLVTIGLVLYRNRWALRWYYYKLVYLPKQRKSQDSVLLQDVTEESIQYPAFIIYPDKSDSIRQWVMCILKNKIEIEWQRRSCFLRHVNDTVGVYDVENITHGLTNSKTALWIICPEFFEDTWCEMASHFALRQLGAQNNALLILENRFECYRVPKHFATLVNPNLGTQQFRFTDDDNGRQLFWSRLEEFIPT